MSRYYDSMRFISNLLGSLQKYTAPFTHPAGTPSNQTMSTNPTNTLNKPNKHVHVPSEIASQESEQMNTSWYSNQLYKNYIKTKNNGNTTAHQIAKQTPITVGKEASITDLLTTKNIQNKPKSSSKSYIEPLKPIQKIVNTHKPKTINHNKTKIATNTEKEDQLKITNRTPKNKHRAYKTDPRLKTQTTPYNSKQQTTLIEYKSTIKTQKNTKHRGSKNYPFGKSTLLI